MYKIGDILPCGFRVMRADIQTERQTDKHTYSLHYLSEKNDKYDE